MTEKKVDEDYKELRLRMLVRWSRFDFAGRTDAHSWVSFWKDVQHLCYTYSFITNTKQIEVGSNPPLDTMLGLLWGLTPPIYEGKKIVQTARLSSKFYGP